MVALTSIRAGRGSQATSPSMTRAAMRTVPLVLRLWRKANSSRYACRCLRPDRAGMCAQEPALQRRDRPVASLQCVLLAPLGLALHSWLVRSLAKAPFVVAGEPVGRDLGVGGDLPVGEALQSGLIVVGRVGEAHAPARLRRHQHQLLVGSALSPDEGLVDLHER